MTAINLQIKKHESSSRINIKKIIPKHTVTKMLKISDREKPQKQPEKTDHVHPGMTSHFS
jgi:hypothetical protein